MGTVHLAKFHGEAGFSRMLAVKRLHPHFATDPDFLCMFLDEARIASRIRHPHVVSVVDVVSHAGELLLAMEYVQGLPLSQVLRLAGPVGVPSKIASAIAGGMLAGLHAAHEAKSDKGEFLSLVHRDVSPQNVMLGEDGVARVVDFGIASAAARLQTTAEGQVKGKLAYMAPEQVGGRPVDRRADIFSAGVVLWEMLTGQRLIEGDVPEKVRLLSEAKFKRPSEVRPELPYALDAVVMKALAKYPSDRYATADEMVSALYAARPPAHAHEARAWLDELARPLLLALSQKTEAAEALSLPVKAPLGSAPVQPLPPIENDEAARNRDQGRDSLTPVPASRPRANASLSTNAKKLGVTVSVIAALLLVLLFLFIFRSENSETQPSFAPDTEPQRSGDKATEAETPVVPQQPPTQHANHGSANEPAGKEPSPKATPPKPPAAAPAARPAKKPAADPCSPPYVLLKGGLKRYKPECL